MRWSAATCISAAVTCCQSWLFGCSKDMHRSSRGSDQYAPTILLKVAMTCRRQDCGSLDPAGRRNRSVDKTNECLCSHSDTHQLSVLRLYRTSPRPLRRSFVLHKPSDFPPISPTRKARMSAELEFMVRLRLFLKSFVTGLANTVGLGEMSQASHKLVPLTSPHNLGASPSAPQSLLFRLMLYQQSSSTTLVYITLLPRGVQLT